MGEYLNVGLITFDISKVFILRPASLKIKFAFFAMVLNCLLFKDKSTLSGSLHQLFVAQGQEQCGVSGADTLFPLAVEENTLLTYQKYPIRIS